MKNDQEECLEKCVVDTLKRTFYLYSTGGQEKVVSCETIDQFMNVLEVVRSKVDDDMLVYTKPF